MGTDEKGGGREVGEREPRRGRSGGAKGESGRIATSALGLVTKPIVAALDATALVALLVGTGVAAGTIHQPFAVPWDHPDLPPAKAALIAKEGQWTWSARMARRSASIL